MKNKKEDWLGNSWEQVTELECIHVRFCLYKIDKLREEREAMQKVLKLK
jgi:hypothetical protein